MKNQPNQILIISLFVCLTACEEPGFGVNGFYISDVRKTETGQNFSFSYDNGLLTGIYSDDPAGQERIWYLFEYGDSGKIEKMSEKITRQARIETRHYSIEQTDLVDLIRTEKVEKDNESQIINEENIRLFKKPKHGFVTRIAVGDGNEFRSYDLVRSGASVIRRKSGDAGIENDYEYYGYDSEINPFRNYLDRFGNLLIIPFTRIICRSPYAYDAPDRYIPANLFSIDNCSGLKSPASVTSHGMTGEKHTGLNIKYNAGGLPAVIDSDPSIPEFESMTITYQYR